MNVQALLQAVEIIRQADGILVTAGAGMGVDSGLPDFQGDQGLWKAYPALGRAQLGFTDIAKPCSFRDTPRLAWGFYGHRFNLYRQTVPHVGFSLMQRIADTKEQGAFVYTSNVDGQFQKSGFANTRVVECHGSIFHLQCTENCTEHIWPAHDLKLDVDDAACELRSDLPVCPECGALARPNILMFGDWSWQSSRTDMQYEWLRMWRNRLKCPVVIEIGAGTAVPTVRRKGEGFRAPLIRINPRDPGMARNGLINLEAGALEGLQALGTMSGSDPSRWLPCRSSDSTRTTYIAHRGLHWAVEAKAILQRLRRYQVLRVNNVFERNGMPQVIRHIDAIARDKKRDVLYLEFHPLNMDASSELPKFLDYRHENDAMRSSILTWLTDAGIGWEPCGGYASERCLIAYLGQVYVDVPFDDTDPVYQILRDYLEYPDGTMRHQGVRFYALSLELAMKNVHHDEPGFWDRWADKF